MSSAFQQQQSSFDPPPKVPRIIRGRIIKIFHGDRVRA
jgi:hypothetical protein